MLRPSMTCNCRDRASTLANRAPALLEVAATTAMCRGCKQSATSCVSLVDCPASNVQASAVRMPPLLELAAAIAARTTQRMHP